MMKRFVRWGAILSAWMLVSTSFAQTPLQSTYQQWQSRSRPDIYSRLRNFSFTSMWQEDAASPSDVVVETLPDGDAANGSADTSAGGTTFHHYGNMYEGAYFGDGHGTGCCGWFGGIYGIGFDRSDDSGTVLSYDAVNPIPAVMTTSSADIDHGPGFEARVGKYLSSCYAIEMSYWGLFPDRRFASRSNAVDGVDLVSAIEFDGLAYNNGTGPNLPLANYFGTLAAPAQFHEIRRSFEAHNVEINLIRNPCRRTSCGQTHFELFAGVRYLKLDDGFRFSSDLNNNLLGDDLLNELHYDIDVDNHLIGFQVGGRTDYKLTQNLSVNGGAKFGVYGNHITHRQQIASGAGILALNSLTEINYDFDVSDNELSFLGELYLGIAYDVTCRWRLTGGYRAISTSGVGLATSQIPSAVEFADMARARSTDHEDSLLLHGAYAGVEYNW